MNNPYTLIFIIQIIFFTQLSAQDISKISDLEIVNTQTNNVVVQIDATNLQQDFLSSSNLNKVNQKEGFNAQLNAGNTLLILTFTKSFNEQELEFLLEYFGFKLDVDNFNQLKELLN